MAGADPFDALNLRSTRTEPSDRFRDQLRGRLVAELGLTGEIPVIVAPARRTTTPTTQELTMTELIDETGVETRSTAEVLVPYLCCLDAAAALTFYVEALGATETLRMVGDDGRVGHAELIVNGAKFYLADEYPDIGVLSPQTLGGSPVNLNLRVDDVDTVYQAALDRGAVGLRPPADQFYGDRTATITDPFGHRWTVSSLIEVLSNAEMAERSAAEGFVSSFGDSGSATSSLELAGDDTTAAPGTDAPAVVEVGYYTIGVADVDKAAAFFRSLFGWQSEPPAAGSVGGLYRHVGNTKLPLGFTDHEPAGQPHLYYRVDSVEKLSERVRQLGGTVISIEHYASGGAASCLDDQGNPFDLWEPAPGY